VHAPRQEGPRRRRRVLAAGADRERKPRCGELRHPRRRRDGQRSDRGESLITRRDLRLTQWAFGGKRNVFPPSALLCIFFVYTFHGGNMRARVQKWGNSLALRIPKAVAEDTGLEQGSEVEMSLEDGQIVVSPVQRPAVT